MPWRVTPPLTRRAKIINAVIAIELEAYLDHHGQIDVVHDQSQPVNGYALYLRYENEQGNKLV